MRQVSWDQKVVIVEEMASFMTQIWDPAFKFSEIGSFYLVAPQSEGSDTLSSTGDSPFRSDISPREVRRDDPKILDFAIGPAVDDDFSPAAVVFLTAIAAITTIVKSG